MLKIYSPIKPKKNKFIPKTNNINAYIIETFSRIVEDPNDRKNIVREEITPRIDNENPNRSAIRAGARVVETKPFIP